MQVSQEELTCIQSEMKVEIKRNKFCKRIDRLKEQESNTAALASSDLDSTFADDDFNFKLNDHFQSTNSNRSSRRHRVQANPPISYSRGLTSYQKRAQAIQADEMKQFGYLLQKRKPISQYWAGAKLFQDEKDSSNTLESDGELQSYIWDWMQSKSAAPSAQEQFTEDEAKRRWPTKTIQSLDKEVPRKNEQNGTTPTDQDTPSATNLQAGNVEPHTNLSTPMNIT